MKRLLKLSAILTLPLVVWACVHATTNAPPAHVVQESEMAGYWRRSGPDGVSRARKAPRILKFSINANGAREVKYCDIGGQRSEGAGLYELKDGTLTISYIDYPDVAHRRGGEVPSSLEYEAQITSLSEDVLELNGKDRYARYQPELDPISGVLKVGICDTAPPIDRPAPSNPALASAAARP